MSSMIKKREKNSADAIVQMLAVGNLFIVGFTVLSILLNIFIHKLYHAKQYHATMTARNSMFTSVNTPR